MAATQGDASDPLAATTDAAERTHQASRADRNAACVSRAANDADDDRVARTSSAHGASLAEQRQVNADSHGDRVATASIASRRGAIDPSAERARSRAHDAKEKLDARTRDFPSPHGATIRNGQSTRSEGIF